MSTNTMDFPLFKLVNESRSTYGLRHQDFGRYQSHCATKVQHLRKSVGLTQTAAKTKKYSKKEVTIENATSARHLQVILFDAERAWAHSQLVKSTLNDPATPGAAKHQMHKRLSRATLHAAKLKDIATSPKIQLSKAQQGQATAYWLYMKGSLAFEQGKHRDGLQSLSVAHVLLTKLADTAETAQSEALANEVIDDIEPMLRFCAYKLEIDTSRGVSAIAEQTATTERTKLVEGYDDLIKNLEDEGNATKRESVSLRWRGQDIPVRSAELVDVVIKVQSALKSLQADQDIAGAKSASRSAEGKKVKGARREVLGARRMGTYDKALLVLSDAENVARQLVEDNKIALSKSSSTRHETSSAPLQLAHACIVYHLLSVRTKRDLLLIADTSSKLATREERIRTKDREYVARTGERNEGLADKKLRKQRARVYPSLVKIYDGIVLSLEQMRDLEPVEQDGDLATLVEARNAAVLASRSEYLSRAYALVERFPSSLALNARAKLYARQARNLASSTSVDLADDDEPDFVGDLLPLTPADMDALDRELESDYTTISKAWYAATGGHVGDEDEDVVEPDDLPVEALSLAAGGKKGMDQNKNKNKSQKKTKKPAFYDVAFNYVAGFDMDAIARRAGLQDAVEAEIQPQVDSVSGTGRKEQGDASAMEAEDAGDASDNNEEEDEDEDEEPVVQEAPKKSGGWGFGLFGRR